jgi:peptidoglycan-N-acetylglucosamine deacetylase
LPSALTACLKWSEEKSKISRSRPVAKNRKVSNRFYAQYMLTALATVGLAAGVSAGGYAYAANWPTSQIFGRTVLGGANPQEIALTYDDGPNDPYTLRLLDILAEYEVRATFFLIGRFVRQHPAIVRALTAAGHTVGNHTMTHPVLLWERPARVREELAGCNAAIEDATGEAVRFFRPPHGARRPDILRTARALGLTPVLWNVMSHDWDATGPGEIVRRVQGRVRWNQLRRKGSNILLHDGSQAELGVDRSKTLEATRSLVQTWIANKMRLVTVAEFR